MYAPASVDGGDDVNGAASSLPLLFEWDPAEDPVQGHECALCVPSASPALRGIVATPSARVEDGKGRHASTADVDADGAGGAIAGGADDAGSDGSRSSASSGGSEGRRAASRHAQAVRSPDAVLTGSIVYRNAEPRNSFRLVVKAVVATPAAPLAVDSVVDGETGPERFSYYRVANPRPDKLLTLRVAPRLDAAGEPIGDPDLYVSNKNAGAGPLSRDTFV